ncbi:tetratricopeptide repeat protein [Niveibacterium terrae]|uniref:tetratricopeptide repeat protein n=1 Tax=Niveibacterium terrae TaxID=3373598 RepID=UPI003A94DE19
MTTPESLERLIGLLTQSIVLRQQEQIPEALACLGEILEIEPGFLPALTSRAELLAEEGRFTEALAGLAPLAASEGVADLYEQIAACAEASFAEKLEARSDDHDVLLARARLFLQTREFDRALNDFDAALTLRPDSVQAHLLRGNALVGLDRLDEARHALDRALDLEPGNALGHFNRGNVFQYQLKFDEAIVDYRTAIALRPDFAEAHLEIAHCLLASGDPAPAWPLYEWRWGTEQFARAPRASLQPLWLGQQELAGTTLLVWAEQGLGDTLQFARFLPRLADRVGELWLRAPAPLHPLLRTLDARITILDEEQALPAHDFQCPLMSLPLALGLGTELGSAPYLKAESERVQAWKMRLGQSTRPRIGLVWAGRQLGPGNPTRDLPFSALAPLLAQDFSFISLQKDIPAGDAGRLADFRNLSDFSGALTDFGESAALIANLDLVIAVDTAIAHLAGALGKPCWVLLRHRGEWRWPVGSDSTPWYPSLRVFRQPSAGDWPGAVRKACAALAEHRREA